MDKLHRNGNNCERPEIRYDNHVLIEQRMFHTFNNKPGEAGADEKTMEKVKLTIFIFFASRCHALSVYPV